MSKQEQQQKEKAKQKEFAETVNKVAELVTVELRKKGWIV